MNPPHQLQNVDLVRLLQQESSAAKTANQDAQEARLRAEQAVTIAEKANQHLAELAQQLSKYLSPQLYLAIFRGEKQVKVGVDRKKLSVLFCDIVNFTSITENMEPMVLASWLNGYLNDMAEIVQTFGGTLDKFIGDAVMVFFGDPHSRGDEQDAIICVKMALVMQQQALARGIFVRIGINTGDVTVGNFGSEARMDYTVIGNTVNVSARLESASMPGKILISEATYALVKSSIYCVPNGFVYLKGIENSVMTYWAIKEYQ